MERDERNNSFQQFRNNLDKSSSPPARTRHLSSQDSTNPNFPPTNDDTLNDRNIYGDEQVEHVNLQNSVSTLLFQQKEIIE